MSTLPDDAREARVHVPRDDSIILVAPSEMAAFAKRLAVLNTKARVFGLEPITVVSTEEVLYQRRFENVSDDRQLAYLVPLRPGEFCASPIRINRIRIEYPQVRLGNWHVVGKLEAIDEGNLTFSVSREPADVAAITRFAEHPIECEHCKTKRRRVDGYVLRDAEAGSYKQVGSNCLEDFTGIDPAAALFLAKMSHVIRLAEDDLAEFGASGRSNAVSTQSYLADVSFLCDHGGFISSAKAKESQLVATYWEAATDFLKDAPSEIREKYHAEREKHLAKADAVRQWVAEKPGEGDFDRNVKLLLKADAISLDRKHLAFAAATVVMHNRYLGLMAQHATPSQHVGEPGQKLTAELTIDRIIDSPNPFGRGTNFLVLMRDMSGNRLKWKTSSPGQDVVKGQGRTMEASFKIKEHSDYKGVPQTGVTHLKVARWLGADADTQPSPDATKVPTDIETDAPMPVADDSPSP